MAPATCRRGGHANFQKQIRSNDGAFRRTFPEGDGLALYNKKHITAIYKREAIPITLTIFIATRSVFVQGKVDVIRPLVQLSERPRELTKPACRQEVNRAGPKLPIGAERATPIENRRMEPPYPLRDSRFNDFLDEWISYISERKPVKSQPAAEKINHNTEEDRNYTWRPLNVEPVLNSRRDLFLCS